MTGRSSSAPDKVKITQSAEGLYEQGKTHSFPRHAFLYGPRSTAWRRYGRMRPAGVDGEGVAAVA